MGKSNLLIVGTGLCACPGKEQPQGIAPTSGITILVN